MLSSSSISAKPSYVGELLVADTLDIVDFMCDIGSTKVMSVGAGCSFTRRELRFEEVELRELLVLAMDNLFQTEGDIIKKVCM